METITSRQNERVKQIATWMGSAAARRESGLCVMHGIKLCAEALRFGRNICAVWVTKTALQSGDPQLTALLEAAQTSVCMSDSVSEKLSPQRTPQDVIALVSSPDAISLEQMAACPRVLFLCGVQDPANIGAAIRTAAALGFTGVMRDSGCADPFSPKALRASMGAAFAVNMAICDAAEDAIAQLRANGHVVVATALLSDAAPVSGIVKQARMTVVVGNEGSGLPQEIISASDLVAYIPITERAESLNAGVAAAIAMWELRP